ncbi:MAG: hypothetical protein MRERC_2c119 [Mycoplasmataceae bacterium RC_NB112A]|nr:MAG: hypothetical protein MRERC_2c119 [Mycoplasmataceae bacterium RC_NB112A]
MTAGSITPNDYNFCAWLRDVKKRVLIDFWKMIIN